MNKTLKIIGLVITLIAVVVAVQVLMRNNDSEPLSNHVQMDTLVVKAKLNHIIENLDNQNVLNEFSDKNFPDKKEIQKLINAISANCDWKKREGGLIDFYASKNIDGFDQFSYIYEFKLACGQLNFIITYNMDKVEPELIRFDFEPLTEESNPSTTKLSVK